MAESESICFTVGEADRGARLDAWLAGRIPDLSRSAAAKWIEAGRVSANGRTPPKSYRVTGGEAISVTPPEAELLDAAPQNIPLDVVYEDADVIVVNKAKGMVVHPAPGHPDGTLVNALLYHCGGTLSGIGGTLRPGVVHRIDRDTTGLVIAAKNDFAHQRLAEQLRDHTLSRVYRCIVVGNPREEAGTVDAPIGRHPADRKKMAVLPLHSAACPGRARKAVTHWRVLERLRGCAYLECRLETGRTHQIRVHMAYTGHPVLGDPLYGKEIPGLRGQCLHAIELRFVHPRTGNPITLSCPLPEAFARELKKLEPGSGNPP